MMFKNAIVRKPGRNFEQGISTSKLGKPDYEKTLNQHSDYVKALKKCKLEVHVLKANESFPDSTFVEDTAVLNKEFAIVTNLGAQSRKGEERDIRPILEKHYSHIESIVNPGTLEGGDVLKVESNYYIGLSARTNKEGAKQLKRILKNYDYPCQMVTLEKVLHLKTGLAYIGDNNLVATGEFIDNQFFKDYNIIKVKKEESYAANCIRVNDYILIPEGFNNLKSSLKILGYQILEINISEFRKMDGGLSCLSLRF